MIDLTYQRPVALSKLHDELLAAIPELRPVDDQPRMTVRGNAEEVHLVVPDDADETAIRAVVEAHDPRPLPPPPDPVVTAAAGLKAAAATETGISAATRQAIATLADAIIAERDAP